ncbi:MAG TPA: PhzF family phenazine biosynthesis protein [Terriglobales bacterium]|jgi:trans-2,3-dihydro-3-hydroxyanthranilate isomerase
MAQREFSFVQLDVFTSRPLEGNQLAVFSDARGLSDDEMQKLARETNLCETTFIIPRDQQIERQNGHKVRIFTIFEELPFAGHPTLGTAWYLRQHSSDDEIVLDLKVGKIPVRFEQRNGLLFGEMRQAEPEFGRTHSHADVAKVLGVPASELDENIPIQTVSTGMPFTIVPFRSLATLQKLNLGWSQMAPYLATIGSPAFFYLVCRETIATNATLHARMIFYNGEDPATGSAAGCCTAWAVKHGVLASDTQGMIEQGIETRRPSSLYIRATKSGETITNVRVGGNVVHVIDGKVTM